MRSQTRIIPSPSACAPWTLGSAASARLPPLWQGLNGLHELATVQTGRALESGTEVSATALRTTSAAAAHPAASSRVALG